MSDKVLRPEQKNGLRLRGEVTAFPLNGTGSKKTV